MVSRHRRSLQKLWRDRCAVFVKEKTADPLTKITEFSETLVADGIPCKLSFSSLNTAEGDGVAAVAQVVKLFVGSEVKIPPGCKLIITRVDGAVLTYGHSGFPAIFSEHQEIMLTLWEDWP